MPATRPRLKIYDVAAESVSDAYTRAITEGAGFVVGPLTKEDVAALLPVSAGRSPVLALNFLGESTSTPRNFYQFALSPEDEARGCRAACRRRRQAQRSRDRRRHRVGQARRRRLRR